MELKPCPFCGGNDLDVCTNAISCNDCGGALFSPDDGDATEAWNRRAPQTADGMVLVPVEPTPKMLDATWNDPAEIANGGGIESEVSRNERIYRAMIAAAQEAK